MRYTLPPMHTLRAFEAAARLRNFTLAGEELHLTASAVSHQIRALEAFYGTALFRRQLRQRRMRMRQLQIERAQRGGHGRGGREG